MTTVINPRDGSTFVVAQGHDGKFHVLESRTGRRPADLEGGPWANFEEARVALRACLEQREYETDLA